MCLLELFRGIREGGGPLKLHVPVLGIFVGRFRYEKWNDPGKKNFFINNSVGLSMCDGPIETVKYIWVNIGCILDCIFSQNCRNLPLLHIADQLVKSTKS